MNTKFSEYVSTKYFFLAFYYFCLVSVSCFLKDPKEFTVPAFASDVASKNTNRHMMKDIILQIVKMSLNF